MKIPRIFLLLFNSFLWQRPIVSLWRDIRYRLPQNIRETIENFANSTLYFDTIIDAHQLKEMAENHIITLAIENTNTCNANCQFCAYRYQKRTKQIMSQKLFQDSILQFVRSGGGELLITPVVGDPLVDEDLINKIKFAKKLKEIQYIYLFTNLIALSKFNINDFLLSGIDEINVSICIASREMYKRIFGVDEYSSVIKNLENLLIENRRLGNKVKVVVHIKAEKPLDTTTSSPNYQHLSNLYGKKLFHIDLEYDNWTGFITKDHVPRKNKLKRISNLAEPCQELYNGAIIFTNGDVGLCWRRDFEAKLVIGNINQNSLEDIWKGKRTRTIRENWLKNNIPDVCRNCLAYERSALFLASSRDKISNLKKNE